jgi:anti-sigma B factor antagonist
MELLRRMKGNVILLDLSGKVVLGESASGLADALAQALKEEFAGVVLNLERIDYLDSTGLGELVGYLTKFEEARKRIAILRPQPRVVKLLAITKLNRVFKTFSEEEKAIEWCERGELNPHGR